MQGIKLTNHESNSIPAMYKDGMEVSAIAEVLYLSKVCVYNYLRKHNIVLRSVPSWSKYRKVAHQRNVLQRQQKFALNID